MSEWIDQLQSFVNENFALPWQRALAVLAIAVVIGWCARLFLRLVIARLARRSGTDLDDKVLGIIARPIFMTVVLVGVHLATTALLIDGRATPDEPQFAETLVKRITQTLGLMIWILAAFRVCRPLLDSLARLADRVQWIESRTVPLIDNFGRVVLFVLGIYALLRIWELDVAPWLASAGVVGLALGLAAKDSLANLFGGMFIIVDAPYELGNYIVLESGERGMVTKIGLRSTRILTRDDVEITIPNAQIAAAKIINEAGGRWEKTRVRVNVGVAYGSEVAEVKRVLMAAAVAVEYALSEPEPRVRFRALGESSLDFQLMVWIEHPELRGRCIDALLTHVYEGLNAAGIGIPFPQRELHIAAPIRTEVSKAGA